MKTLNHNLKVATIIAAGRYGASQNCRAVDLLGIAAATGTLTMATKPIDGDTVTIGATVYRFKDSPAQAYDVYIGSTAADSQAHLVVAINASGVGDSSDYYTGTAVHPTVTASAFASNVMTITAKSAGTDGNSIATTETLTAAGNVFGAAVLSGGRDDVASCDSALILLSIGAIAGAPTSVKVKIQEANDVAFGTTPTTALGGEEITITKDLLRNTMQRFEVTATKRYLRAVITFTGGSSPTADLAATAVLSDIAVPYPIVLQNV